MAITAAELVLYGSANRPTNDSSTTGGAIDATFRPFSADWSADAVAEVVSDGADTRTVRITGRLTTGVIDTEDLVLNGTTPVTGAKTWMYLLEAKIQSGGASGTRTVDIKQGASGTTRHQILPNEVGGYRLFYASVSDTSPVTRFEKVFFKNTNGTLTLTSAAVRLTADPSSRIRIGCAPSVGDSATIANRLATPGSVTFVDDGVDQGVPGGSVAAGAAIGVWIEQALLAPGAVPDPAFQSSFTVRLSGQTT